MGPIGRGTCAAIIAAFLCAAAWTALSYFSEWRLGILALVVGATVGAAMAVGADRRGGMAGGALAALIALSAMIGSRYVLTRLELNAWTEEMSEVSDEDAVLALAGSIYDSQIESDDVEELLTPDGEYSPTVLRRAERAWERMSPDEQAELKASIADDSREAFAEASPLLMGVGLLFNIGLTGLVLMALGTATAWRMGSYAPADGEGATQAQTAGGSAAGETEKVTVGPLRAAFKLPDDPLEGTAAAARSLTSSETELRKAA